GSRGAGRQTARLPRAGDAPRGEHDRRQGERRRDRPRCGGDQGGGRTPARAAGERGMMMVAAEKKGARPVVLAAPSGTGKTTIAHRLVEGTGDFIFSVSATTRRPRKGERNGMDYEFLGRPEFEDMR